MLLGWVGFSQRCSLACLNLLNDMMSLTSEELSRSDLSFGFDISSLQIHGRFFQNGNLSIVLDGWYGIHSWNKIAWSL